jgi:leucyl aminopeptidase
MEIHYFAGKPSQLKSELLFVPVFEDDKSLPEPLQFLYQTMQPPEQDFFAGGNLQAKLGRKTLAFTAQKNLPKIIFLGAGKKGEWDLEKVRQWWGTVIVNIRENRAARAVIYWDKKFIPADENDDFLIEAVAALRTAEYRVKDFLTEQEEPEIEIKSLDIWYPGGPKNLESSIDTGNTIGESVNFARWLAESPSNVLTPEKFTGEVSALSKIHKWNLEILDRKMLEKNGFGALLAVARGSENPPFLTIAAYGHKKAKKTVGLVGKGVTFDSGGISIKPAKRMEEMKYDMCGAAAVLGVLKAVSLTGLPVNVVGAMPLVENMPSGTAIRPGDIVKSYSGKTIEIINTDAEGRLILADALSYVQQKYQPDVIIDLATLTGSVVVALGHISAAVLSSDPALLQPLQKAADISGERIWPLPLWDDYKELMKSKIADIRNLSNKPGGGTITAAHFLQSFVKEVPWIHLDIAGVAWNMPEKSYRPAGATGFGVRLQWHWLRILSES